MFKKTVNYSDFDGNSRTETLYFNLSTTEFYTLIGDLRDYDLDAIMRDNDIPRMIDVFQKFILSAYGEKSIDGKRFVKSDEIRENFSQSAAYDALIESFLNDGQEAYTFLLGLIPAKLSEAMTANGIDFKNINAEIQNGNVSGIDDLKIKLIN